MAYQLPLRKVKGSSVSPRIGTEVIGFFSQSKTESKEVKHCDQMHHQQAR